MPPRRQEAQEFLAVSFDHLVGTGEECGRDREAERGRGFKVDNKLEDSWLLDSQIRRLRSLQQLVHVSSGAVANLEEDGAIRYETACFYERTMLVHRRQ